MGTPHKDNEQERDSLIMTAPLPEGVSAEAMSSAIERFRRIVGDEWVFMDENLSPYDDPYTISNDEDDYKAYAAIAPHERFSIRRTVLACEITCPMLVATHPQCLMLVRCCPGALILDRKCD